MRGAFRGFVVPDYLTDEDWAAFEATGANLTRMFINLDSPGAGKPYQLPADAYTNVDQMLSQAKRRNFKALVVFNPLPKAPDSIYWFDTVQQDSIVAILEAFARHYSGENTFAGFDIINEPYPIAKGHPEAPRNFDGPTAWKNLSARIITAVRRQDPTRIIVYEWPYWAGNYNNLQPIAFDGVVYSTHWYTPHEVTHQGIKDRPLGIPYPTDASYGIGVWNRDTIKSYFLKVKQFQQIYQLPVYFGEFSCIRSAPGRTAFRYDADVVSLLEEMGFSWTYHAFRQAADWDPELRHGDPTEARSANTDVMRLLRQIMLTKNP